MPSLFATEAEPAQAAKMPALISLCSYYEARAEPRPIRDEEHADFDAWAGEQNSSTNSDKPFAKAKQRLSLGLEKTKKARAIARASMWCNRMLVNGSTANFEQLHFGFACLRSQHSYGLSARLNGATMLQSFGEWLCGLV